VLIFNFCKRLILNLRGQELITCSQMLHDVRPGGVARACFRFSRLSSSSGSSLLNQGLLSQVKILFNKPVSLNSN